MRYADLEKFGRIDDEAIGKVEGQSLNLGIEHDGVIAATARKRDQSLQQGPPDTASALGGKYRHAPDMAIGQETGSTHDLALAARNRVQAGRIPLIDFNIGRHALFDHKHRDTNGHGQRTRISPTQYLDFERHCPSPFEFHAVDPGDLPCRHPPPLPGATALSN